MTGTPRHEATRTSILRAAVEEFAERGEDGARMEAIAKAAGVNKALLHYYFGNKEGLYLASLDWTLAGLKERSLLLLEGPGTPGLRMLRYLLWSFRGMATRPTYSRMMGYEMMRAKAGDAASLTRVVDGYFRPLVAALTAVLEEGMTRGEFRPVDPAHTILTLLGTNVFYFHSAPVFREISGRDPREPELLERRRHHLADLAAGLLFADREAGSRIAAQVLRETAAPNP